MTFLVFFKLGCSLQFLRSSLPASPFARRDAGHSHWPRLQFSSLFEPQCHSTSYKPNCSYTVGSLATGNPHINHFLRVKNKGEKNTRNCRSFNRKIRIRIHRGLKIMPSNYCYFLSELPITIDIIYSARLTWGLAATVTD